jgi:hypothetical protein
MSESEKKSAAWPWIVVPLTAVILFFVLRECQHRLPPAEHATAAPVTVPAAPDTPPQDPAPPADAATAPAPEPAPQ